MATRLLRLLPVALIALCLLAGSASAAVLERRDTTILYTAVDGEVVDLTTRGAPNSNAGSRQISVNAIAGTITSLAPCFGTGSTRTCSHLVSGALAERLRFETVGGNDKIDASGTALPSDASLPTEFATGAGTDTITGSIVADSVFAGAGADRITGGPGEDVLRGEDGDDTFVDVVDGDTVTGGPGVDVLDLTGAAAGMAISLDGAPNDGPLGGGANIDVENVRGTPETDLLTGGAGANELDGGGGNDTIDVRGGGVDVVDCGVGADRALADVADVVAGCETVEREPDPSAAPPPVDADGDGVVAGVDCDDRSAARHQGARDVPGNGVDEDCSGADARLVAVPARVSFLWAAFADGTEARTLRVRSVPRGGRVSLRCSRRRACGFARRSATVRRDGSAGLLRFLRKRRLPPGTVVEVRVSAPEHITAVTRFVMRARKLPRKQSLCLPAGASSPRRCAR